MNNKLIVLALTSLLSLSAFALGNAELKMTCGVVKKARSAKLLNRLEPGFFGLNSKYVLLTKFENPIGYNESHSKETYSSNSFTTSDMEKTFTRFSWKDKFVKLKKSLRAAIKSAKKKNIDLYACVGRIDTLFKYAGAEVYYSTESVEAAANKMRKQARRHL